MSTQVQFRRGTTTDISTFTGADGEIVVDTTKKTCVVNDGIQLAGYPLLREDGSNSALAPGSISSCALKFQNDANTGIISPGEDQVALVTGGASRLLVDSSGAVTIPGNLLVSGSLTASFTFNDGSAPSPSISFVNDPDTGFFRSGTNEISLSTGGTSRLTATTTEFTSSLPVAHPLGAASTPSITFTGDLNTGIYSPGADQVAISTNSTERVEFGTSEVVFNDGGENYDFRIEGDTNSSLFFVDASADAVGIGTTTAARRLHVAVAGNDPQLRLQDTSATESIWSAIEFNGDSSRQAFIGKAGSSDLLIINDSASGALRFSTDATERARIDSLGRLLVGTSSALNSDSIIEGYKASGNTYLWVQSNSLGNAEFARGIFISGARSGQIGVYKNTSLSNPAGFIYTQREDGSDAWFWTDNSGDFRISNLTTNIGTTGGTVVGTQTSDGRLKNILGTVEYGLETVKQFETVRYSLKARPEVEKIGFIAQQILPLVPESVFDTNEPIEGEPEDAPTKLGMEYVSLIPVLVNAIKELSAEVDTLKAKLQAS